MRGHLRPDLVVVVVVAYAERVIVVASLIAGLFGAVMLLTGHFEEALTPLALAAIGLIYALRKPVVRR